MRDACRAPNAHRALVEETSEIAGLPPPACQAGRRTGTPSGASPPGSGSRHERLVPVCHEPAVLASWRGGELISLALEQIEACALLGLLGSDLIIHGELIDLRPH